MFFLFQVRCVLLVVRRSRRRDISIQVSDAGRDAICDHRLHRAREQALQFSPFWRRAGPYVLPIPLKKTYKKYHVKNVKNTCLKKISDALRIVDFFFLTLATAANAVGMQLSWASHLQRHLQRLF